MRQVALAVLLVLFAATPAAAATNGSPSGPGPSGVVIGVNVHENGDATWNVTATYPLDSQSDRRAFSQLSSEFTSGGDVFVQPSAFQSAASTASERTGRSMSIADVRRGERVRNGTGTNATGVLTLKFRWNGFANATNGNITVGDAFQGGLLGDLTANETMYVVPPNGYRVSSASSSDQLRNYAVYWYGPHSFDGSGPHVEIKTAPDSTFPLGGLGGIAVVVLAALLLGATVTYVFARRSDLDLTGASRNGGETEAGGDSETGEAATGVAATDEATDGVDEELLSDEERVERLLEENGGRMKQAKIVEETRWSNAKVSQLLSAMADEDRVEKLRIGRENLISLPDYDEE